jgi:hypothetical protein
MPTASHATTPSHAMPIVDASPESRSALSLRLAALRHTTPVCQTRHRAAGRLPNRCCLRAAFADGCLARAPGLLLDRRAKRRNGAVCLISGLPAAATAPAPRCASRGITALLCSESTAGSRTRGLGKCRDTKKRGESRCHQVLYHSSPPHRCCTPSTWFTPYQITWEMGSGVQRGGGPSLRNANGTFSRIDDSSETA